MKKLLALVIALIMVFSLFACGGKDADTDPAPNAGTDPAPGTNTDTTPDADVGDTSGGDFTAASGFAIKPSEMKVSDKKYKIAYVGFSWDNTVEHTSDLMENAFTKYLNCEYTAISSEGNPDTFIQNIENYISQGYDALICNVYSVTTGRASEICAENDVIWMPVTAPATNYDGELVAPYVGVNDRYIGHTLVQEAYDWATANWSDFETKDAYVYIIDVSSAEELHRRCVAMEEKANELFPDAVKVEVGDSLAEGGGFSPEVAYNMCVRTFAANPDVKYWIVLHPFDYYVSGTCRAAEDYNIVDNVLTACCNGDNYIPVLTDGTSGCWRFCLYWDNGVWGELIACGLYALVSGQCTAEELWSDYIDEGTNYAGLRMAPLVMGPDNYQEVLGFYDNYLDYDYYGYKDSWKGTEFDVLYVAE